MRDDTIIYATREAELMELAWGVIANAGGGDWDKESLEWQQAASRWRDSYHAWLDEQYPPAPPQVEGQPDEVVDE